MHPTQGSNISAFVLPGIGIRSDEGGTAPLPRVPDVAMQFAEVELNRRRRS